jgi:hypothetical protein
MSRPSIADMAYAVSTKTCTYLLDDDGVCRWTLAPSGYSMPGAARCIGAQFVASLDLREPGGLAGELRVGSAALFVRSEEGRFVLLKTTPILGVENRRTGKAERIEAAPSEPSRETTRSPEAPPVPPSIVDIPPAAPTIKQAVEIPMEDLVSFVDGDLEVSVEELVTFSEITLTIPLFRADSVLPPNVRSDTQKLDNALPSVPPPPPRIPDDVVPAAAPMRTAALPAPTPPPRKTDDAKPAPKKPAPRGIVGPGRRLR